jgi:hypothetical protein
MDINDDVDLSVKAAVGDLFLQLVTARAVIRVLEREKATAVAGRSGGSDGARGADGPDTKAGSHG